MKNNTACRLVVLASCVTFASTVLAQGDAKSTPSTPSALCNRDNGLTIIGEQIDGSRTLDDMSRRIGVLIRAADLLWIHQEQKARATFTEAIDLAVRDYRASGEVTKQEGRMPVSQPDQRFNVIAAVAKRDPAWAKKLSDQVQQETAETENKSTKNPQADAKMAERIMSVASGLLPGDPQTAIGFARTSLRYPASIYLPGFLYRLSEVNRSLSDQYYQEALNAYREAPMDQFLYLSSYPFGNTREAGEMPTYTIYRVPEGYRPNPALQRAFTQTLLTRAQELIAAPTESTGGRFTEAGQMWMAFSRLESQVQSAIPDLLPAVQQAKGSLFGLVSQKDQARVTQTLVEPPKRSFDERIEDALKQTDPARRESGVALAIISGSDDEELDHVVATADKIDDTQLRAQVLSRLFYNRSRKAISEKRLDEARRLAVKVDDLDLRAYLYSQVATETLKSSQDDAQAREMLEEVLTAAAKAPDTEVKARALFGVAYLYAKFDANRAVSVLGDVVKSINRIEAPDFSRDFVIKRIEGKSFGSYTTIQTPGFNPDNAFREMGKLDFDGTLYQSANFSNKPLRSMTTLAVVEPCLKQIPKTKPAKTPAKP